MSDTQSYKTVNLSHDELMAIAFAIDARLIALRASSLPVKFPKVLEALETALVKVEAAL